MTFFAPDRYETDRFVLRSYMPGDGPVLNEAVLASYDHLKTFLPWPDPKQTVEQAEETVRMFRAHYLLNKDFVVSVWNPEETELIGGTGFHRVNLKGSVADIGMWISSTHAHQGLGAAVLTAMLTWGFSDQWPWERLTWHCDERNAASRRCAEKGGLLLEGKFTNDAPEVGPERRTTYLYAATRNVWASN